MIDKTQYSSIEIPGSLGEVVQEAVAQGLAGRRRAKALHLLRRAGAAAAVFLLCSISALNLFPTFADAACELPVVGGLCRVFLFREYHAEDPVKYIDVEIPQM